MTNFADEVNPTGMNDKAMNFIDEYLFEDQEEEPSAKGLDNLNIIDSA